MGEVDELLTIEQGAYNALVVEVEDLRAELARVREIVGAEDGEDTVSAVRWWLAELEHYEHLAERYRASGLIEAVTMLCSGAQFRGCASGSMDPDSSWIQVPDEHLRTVERALIAWEDSALAPTPREERARGRGDG